MVRGRLVLVMKKEKKVRTAMLVVDGDELRRIVEEGLGGITFEAEIRHSRIVLTARTGEDEEVKSLQVD